MRVLFIGAGKRLEMAQKFIAAGWEVHSYEYDTNCPLNKIGIKILKGKRWKDMMIKQELFELCCSYDLVLPFQDEATKILSEIKEENLKHSEMLCVSGLFSTTACLNKQDFETYFKSQPFYPTPQQGKPVVVKPIYGFGSKGIKYIENWGSELIDNCILQRKIEGGNEYSLDCYFDKTNCLIDFVPRKRIEVVGGEVVKSVTVDRNSFAFEEIIKSISKNLLLVGPICIQVISDSNGLIWIMEINARFGGGCTLSLASGFDIIDMLKTEYVDKKSIQNYKSVWKSGLHMSRCFVDYYHEKNSI